MHSFLSDTFQITGDNSDKKKTFLYEYCGDDKQFTFNVIDEIIMARLQKNKDENKFVYLIQAYRRVDSHLYVTQKLIENY